MLRTCCDQSSSFPHSTTPPNISKMPRWSSLLLNKREKKLALCSTSLILRVVPIHISAKISKLSTSYKLGQWTLNNVSFIFISRLCRKCLWHWVTGNIYIYHGEGGHPCWLRCGGFKWMKLCVFRKGFNNIAVTYS